jgi:hypothetical protein
MLNMRYIDVKWLHQSPQYPIRLVSEIDSDDYEVRKLEFFQDGHVGFACAAASQDGVELGTVAVPSTIEINAMEEFEAKEISQADFETLWDAIACN